MRTVIQRVSRAKVTVKNETKGEILHGLLLLVGIKEGDSEEDIEWQVNKIMRLRIFEDNCGKMNRSVLDIGGSVLIVPQFTLYGDASKGTRPSFTQAASADKAEKLFNSMIDKFKKSTSVNIQTGEFGANMEVELLNDGPVTIILER